MKSIMLLGIVALIPIEAQAEGYVDGCLKQMEAQALEGIPEKLKAEFRKICTCQEAELRKRGVSSEELRAFVKNAGSSKLDPETMKVAPKINKLIQSEEVKKSCGSLFD